MKITHVNNYSNINFCGYDARKLKSIVITDVGDYAEIGTQLDNIAHKNGFSLDTFNDNKLRPLSYCFEKLSDEDKADKTFIDIAKLKILSNIRTLCHVAKGLEPNTNGFKASDNTVKWAQDIATVTPNGNVIVGNKWGALGRNISGDYNLNIVRHKMNHISGGNIFFVKGDKGEEALIGEYERKKMDRYTGNLYEDLGVKNIVLLPQMDYHIDLFVRPLDNKRILVANDELSLLMFDKAIDVFENAIAKSRDCSEINQLEDILQNLTEDKLFFESSINKNMNATYEEVVSVLNKNNYKTIPVPGRIYDVRFDDILTHMSNYMNAIVTFNKKNDLIYITNKSSYDKKLGITDEIKDKYNFSTEKYFVDFISDYIKPKNIYFVSGRKDAIADLLTYQGGGVHCLACEIPR